MNNFLFCLCCFPSDWLVEQYLENVVLIVVQDLPCWQSSLSIDEDEESDESNDDESSLEDDEDESESEAEVLDDSICPTGVFGQNYVFLANCDW